MKKYIYTAVLLIVVGGLAVLITPRSARAPGQNEPKVFTSYKNAEYLIDGAPVILGTNGTQYFGDEVTGDFNGDGRQDVGFIFTSQPGGSGTFYYVAAALGADRGYIGTNAVLLGDRIAPQAVMAQNNGILVSYATRRDNEPMTTQPHITVSSFYQLQNGQLVYKGSR